MHKHTWVFKFKNPKLKKTWKPNATTHMGFQAKKIQSWKKLENHMHQHTWVFKLENLELKVKAH
jgi:hypothetical protein